ncbi:uncharacterized protein LOC118507111 [Anopheles stephensi]|uniref:uncharacterized protein LOC118507111 n=1 Tax=Anopheles stephensi TaxID=30069 RepID=UPI001658BEA5|nr:uncharacterized protein LOC118507111 [Anopheles stephensi]
MQLPVVKRFITGWSIYLFAEKAYLHTTCTTAPMRDDAWKKHTKKDTVRALISNDEEHWAENGFKLAGSLASKCSLPPNIQTTVCNASASSTNKHKLTFISLLIAQ